MRHALTVLLACAVGASAAEEPWLIGSEGVLRRTTAAETLTRPITFARTGASGLEATFIAASLRGAQLPDWRTSQRIAGTRHDERLHQPISAFGSEDERRRFGIEGGPGDWDDFSVQWDGLILIPPGGADLATTSDDGSRVWLDLDRDGAAEPGEWGGNGWGNGQGATLRLVHAAVAPGTWPIRVQYEEGGGGNSCSLMWRPSGSSTWAVVPAEAFARTPVLTLEGPITFAAPVSGDGELHAGDGTVLARAPRSGLLSTAGRVRLAADLDAEHLRIVVQRDSTLDLAGHRLACEALVGDGTLQLGGGTLAVAASGNLTIHGPGRLEARGEIALAGIAGEVEIALTGPGAVRSAERSLVRCALRAPLATVLELGAIPAGAGRLSVDVDGPLAGAGLMAWRADRHGRWFQRLAEPHLRDGRQHVDIDVSAAADFQPIGHDAAWNALTAAESGRTGLLIYADHPLAGTVLADARWLPDEPHPGQAALAMAKLPPSQAATGERIEVQVRPTPFPELPFDPDCFRLELAVIAPDRGVTTYAGFADQPFRRLDRGDREELLADGPPCFAVRFRARQPGVHRMRLIARWAGGGNATVELPPLTASGTAWDDIARVDAGDPRFLSSQGSFVWPIGQNLNSTYDVRSRQNLGTRLTPDRGTFTREAFLERLIAAGGTGAETWLSPWNLGLEWTDAWTGFHGAGRPNLGNAWALDRYLAIAEQHGVRVVLSIFNHGQGRDGSGAEDDWPHHPWRDANRGWLDRPAGLFSDPRALKAQADLFRYLAARWGDSPAVLTWKLWAEVNLTHAPNSAKQAWHAQATQAFARVDPWRHPVTTHWCGDFRNADPVISSDPGLGMLTIDAYHDSDANLAVLLGQSTRDARRNAGGLAGFGKPVLVTEFGGSAGACSAQRMEAELAIGGWAALVHGHAGAPMLWWFEWIDQGGHYGSFGALRRYLAGEDLRNPTARTVALELRADGTQLWCRAWQRSGRILGYVLDPSWAVSGGDSDAIENGILDLGPVNAGRLRLEWWDADLGVANTAIGIDHQGGPLRLSVPAFRRHLAFKLWRVEG